MNDISRALTNERGFIKFSAAALGESEQSLEANLNNPLRSWDGRDGVGAATARKAMRAYTGAHKMFAMSAITAQNRATDEPDSADRSGAVF